MTSNRCPLSTASLVTADELATFLGCSPKHVQRIARRGVFPKPIRIGRLCRWQRHRVEQWLADQQ
jgi:predicted DNA-binding transcriptional regulator AlpA